MATVLIDRRATGGGRPEWVRHKCEGDTTTRCGARVTILNSEPDTPAIMPDRECKRCFGKLS